MSHFNHAAAPLPPQPQSLGPSSSLVIPYVFLAPHILPESVGQSGNPFVQHPFPYIQTIVPTTKLTTIPFIHPYQYPSHIISYPSHVQEPSFPFFGE